MLEDKEALSNRRQRKVKKDKKRIKSHIESGVLYSKTQITFKWCIARIQQVLNKLPNFILRLVRAIIQVSCLRCQQCLTIVLEKISKVDTIYEHKIIVSKVLYITINIMMTNGY